MFATPQHTPIADYFRGQSPSMLSVRGQPEDVSAPSSRRGSPHVCALSLRKSDTPVITVGIDSGAEGDWSSSVLKEAEASSSAGEDRSRYRVKDAIKLFESR